MSRMNFHATILKLNVHYCMLFSSRVWVWIRWLVSCYAHVLVLLEVVYVIVTDRDLFFGRPQSVA